MRVFNEPTAFIVAQAFQPVDKQAGQAGKPVLLQNSYIHIFIRSRVKESMSNFFSSLMEILSPTTNPAL